MSLINPLTHAEASPQTRQLFDTLSHKIGKVPNVYAVAGHSPATLKGVLDFSETLGGGELTGKEVEAVALVVGEENGCDYCVSAHTVVGKMQGFSEADTVAVRDGSIRDEKLSALTNLAREIVATRGRPSELSVQCFFDAGYNQGALVNVLGLVALNTFTNYTNHIAQTPIDFPAAPELDAVAV